MNPIPNFRVVPPRYATAQELCMYHDRDYINFILGPGSRERQPYTQSQIQEQELDLFSEYGVEDVSFRAVHVSVQ